MKALPDLLTHLRQKAQVFLHTGILVRFFGEITSDQGG
jgi:hypothetical protein